MTTTHDAIERDPGRDDAKHARQRFTFGPYQFDPIAGLLHGADLDVTLAPREAAVLHLLVTRAGELVGKRELLRTVWPDVHVTESSLTDAISSLRQALADHPRKPTFIQTVYRRGYRFLPVVSAVDLRSPVGTESDTDSPPAKSLPGRRIGSSWGRLALAIFVGWLGGTGFALLPRDDAASPVRLKLHTGLHADHLTFSPNGEALYFRGEREGLTRLYRRPLDQFLTMRFPQTEDVRPSGFSPDGAWLLAQAGESWSRISAQDGTRLPLSDHLTPSATLTWGPEGDLLAGTRQLTRIPLEGDDAKVLTELGAGQSFRWPRWLPGGKSILYTRSVEGQAPRLGVYDRARQGLSDLGVSGTDARYLPTGHILFGRSSGPIGGSARAVGTLLLVPFDLARLRVTGEPRVVAESVAIWPNGKTDYAVSTDGKLAYLMGDELPDGRSLIWLDRDGSHRPASARRERFRSPSLSPDGRQVVSRLEALDGEHLWILDLEHDTLRRLTTDGPNFNPVWSPDGSWIAYSSWRASRTGIYLQAADGNDEARWIAPIGRDYTFSPDSASLIYLHHSDLWQAAFDDGAQPQRILEVQDWIGQPTISPDGRWMAYLSAQSGRSEVYVRSYPEFGEEIAVSDGGGVEPKWSTGGNQLFYREHDRLMVVDVGGAADDTLGKPRLLTHFNALLDGRGVQWGVAPDGRFLLAGAHALDQPTPIRIVIGWLDEVRAADARP